MMICVRSKIHLYVCCRCCFSIRFYVSVVDGIYDSNAESINESIED